MLHRWWVLALPSLLLTGARMRPPHTPDVQPASKPVRVEGANHYALAIEVCVTGSGINQRLETVHPGMDASFTLPHSLVLGGPVEFEAQPTVREPLYREGSVLLAPGDVLCAQIAAVWSNSTVTVRP